MRTFALGFVARVFVLGVLVSGCSGAPEDDPSQSSDDALIGGTATVDEPAVGELYTNCNSKTCTYCTATLVAPRVVLTAAHCLEYKTQQRAGNYGSFVIQKSASESHEFTISRYRAFATSGPGDNDLGLVQLSANVPSSIARPGSLARNMPPNGTKVTDYGYGCTDPNNTKKGTGVKRKRTHTQGAGIRELCPGDSGGPMFWGNAVFAVNSGFKSALFENDDIYATVPNHYAALQGQANAWR